MPTHDGDFMLRSCPEAPYPYFTTFQNSSFWQRENEIWGDVFHLTVEVYIPNTLRAIAVMLIFSTLWTIVYWIFNGIQACFFACCSSIQTASKWAAYARLGFVLFSMIWYLLGFVAAMSAATFDPTLIIGIVPISSLVFMAGLAGTMQNLAGGVAVLYAGIIEPGLVISFNSENRMVIQGVITSIGYQYVYILASITSKDQKDCNSSLNPTRAGVPNSKTIVYSQIDGSSKNAFFRDYSSYFGFTEDEVVDDAVVWVYVVPLSVFTSHTISFPHGSSHAPLESPAWTQHSTTENVRKRKSTCPHINHPSKLKTVPVSFLAGEDVVQTLSKDYKNK